MYQAFRSENQFVDWLRRCGRSRVRGLRLGIGDDAGVIKPSPGHEMLLTADLLIEGIHFLRRLHPPEAVGHRALARSLSDVAAMGGKPKFALISLALHKQIDRTWIEGFYGGLLRLARRSGVAVLGGDTAHTRGPLVADVVVVGEVATGRALLRAGARKGDAIYVAGTLGLSALGLRLLQLKARARNPRALKAHLYPEPQCRLGQFLVEKRLASAAIDLSDGLSTDLGRLLRASRVGGRIWEELIPKISALGRGNRALSLALDGGEDYSLLFTVPRSKVSRLPFSFEGIQLHQIGEVCAASRGIIMAGRDGSRPLTPRGYDHFKR